MAEEISSDLGVLLREFLDNQKRQQEESEKMLAEMRATEPAKTVSMDFEEEQQKHRASMDAMRKKSDEAAERQRAYQDAVMQELNLQTDLLRQISEKLLP